VGSWQRQVQLAERVLRGVLQALPAPVRERAAAIEIVFEKRPSAFLVRSGIEPDVMGLFEGPSLAEPEGEDTLLAPRILLFLDNIMDEAQGDEAAFCDEVRTTLLHEIGHYLGLDEEGLSARDLE